MPEVRKTSGMPTSPYTALTDLAVRYAEGPPELPQLDQLHLASLDGEPIMAEVGRLSTAAFLINDWMQDFRAAIEADPDLCTLAAEDSSSAQMVLYPTGGIRLPLQLVPSELFGSALIQRFLLGLDGDQATLATLLLDGLQELKRALRGEPVRFYSISGLGGLPLNPGTSIDTPWGNAIPAPRVSPRPPQFRPTRTTALLIRTHLASVTFSQEKEPEHEVDEGFFEELNRAARLFPLACALGSGADDPSAPTWLWSTGLVQFLAGHGYSASEPPLIMRGAVDVSDRIAEIERWARVIEEHHDTAVDIAGQRIVSALSWRSNPADALIDAVTAWENLVGTSTETTFRVTAALACLLEREVEARIAMRKLLNKTYDVRSRLVHGETVDPREIEEARKMAIQTAIRALQACYRLGRPWLTLKSKDRADQLLLGGPSSGYPD